MSAHLVNQILSTLTIFGQVVAGVLLFLILTKKIKNFGDFFSRNGFFLALVVALTATVGSLTYSWGLGYEPCEFCWFQRILMYPLVIILAMGLWKKRDSSAGDYALGLSIPGALIAGYHYLLQIGVTSYAPCDALGYSVSCSKVFVMNFGYITIPLMAFSAFLLIILFVVASKATVSEQ